MKILQFYVSLLLLFSLPVVATAGAIKTFKAKECQMQNKGSSKASHCCDAKNHGLKEASKQMKSDHCQQKKLCNDCDKCSDCSTYTVMPLTYTLPDLFVANQVLTFLTPQLLSSYTSPSLWRPPFSL